MKKLSKHCYLFATENIREAWKNEARYNSTKEEQAAKHPELRMRCAVQVELFNPV